MEYDIYYLPNLDIMMWNLYVDNMPDYLIYSIN